LCASIITQKALERPSRLLHRKKCAYGGKVTQQNFGGSVNRYARFALSKRELMLADIYDRLWGVVIECLDFEEFIKRYDRQETFFYVDPPDLSCEDMYGQELFDRADLERLATMLSQIKGRCLISLNDHAEIREFFSDFEIDEGETRYSLAGGQRRVKGLLISNETLSKIGFKWFGD